MEGTATSRDNGPAVRETRIQLLVADDDALARSQLAAWARDGMGDIIVVVEAEDGAEAIQLGLQQRPDIALLDVDLPRLGGFEAAVTLRELHPRLRLGLQTADPRAHGERAREHVLPLFSKGEFGRLLSWLRAQVQWCLETPPEPRAPEKRSFVCGACGYGALRADAPESCPMCRAESAWVEAQRRPSGILVAG